MRRKNSSQPMLLGFEDLNEKESRDELMKEPEASVCSAVIDEHENEKLPNLSHLQKEFGATKSLTQNQTIIVVDSHSLIYQVFHAMPPMTSPAGVSVGAVHGFLRDLADLRDKWQPDFLVCAFDSSGKTFRSELYPEYKAQRESMPEDLRSQIPLIREALVALGIPSLEASGFEADDIMATIALRCTDANANCVLVTSDKDCRQLLSDRVKMLNVRKNEFFGPEQLLATWGIRPEQVVDFQSLVGDSVDNVPGIPLIGPKFAQQLIQQYGTLQSVLDHADEVPGAKRKENLKNFRDQAYLSQSLVALRTDVPVSIAWEAWSQMQPDAERVADLFRELGLRRLSERFIVPANPSNQVLQPIDRSKYRRIVDLEQLGWVIEQIGKSGRVAVDTETTSTRARTAELVGISLAWGPGLAVYLPVRGPQGEHVLPLETVLQQLKPLLENPKIPKSGQNLKFDLIVLRSHGIRLQGIVFDTMVADYLLDPGQRNHSLEDIAKRHLQYTTIPISDLIGTGKYQKQMDQVPIDLVTAYACEDVDIPIRLVEPLLQRLQEENLKRLFDDLEIPLIDVLAELEFNGIHVDVDRLQAMGEDFNHIIERLQEEIREAAGYASFNPDSPKQLAKVLFDQLKLPVIKKSKSGPSTDVDVLQELASRHPLPAKIIEYRQAVKLKGTYIDALPTLVSPKTGRLHTSFRQDVAATGRLSSSDPNLQNIPVRTEDGRRIRSAFRPGPEGWILMTADYSQIELRVLAHYCGDPTLCHAFAEDLDVHTTVASQVYGVPLNHVSSAMRRSAKAINFGIIYGQSPFGLAKSLSITKGEAAAFIDAYFEKYQGVQNFIASTIQSCRKNGFVETMSGRKRWLKGVRDFQSLDAVRRKILLEPERMAINTVIQGSAADLIKMAMIAIHRELSQSCLQAKMLLQIHDELIFEVESSQALELANLVRHNMTSVVSLGVPLRVDIKTGPNWSECDLA